MHTDTHPEDIKAALRKAGTSLSRLARLNGGTPQALSAALRLPMPKWERVIANALGAKPETLWPGRYAERARRQAARAALRDEIAAARLPVSRQAQAA
jgi:Ner family transcriptional regulator